MAIEEEKLAELKKKHGDDVVVVALSDGRSFAFRAAKAADWRKCRSWLVQIVTKPEVAAVAYELIARDLCVWPDKAAFDVLRDEAPNLATEIGDALIGKVGEKLSARVGESRPC